MDCRLIFENRRGCKGCRCSSTYRGECVCHDAVVDLPAASACIAALDEFRPSDL